MTGNKTTTWTGVGTRICAALGFLAAAPYQLGAIAEILPPAWKPYILGSSIVAGFILGVWNAVAQAGQADVAKLENRVDDTLTTVANAVGGPGSGNMSGVKAKLESLKSENQETP